MSYSKRLVQTKKVSDNRDPRKTLEKNKSEYPPQPGDCAHGCTRALDWNGFRVANDRKSRSRIG